QIEEFTNKQKRYIVAQGITATSMGSDYPDPKMNAETLIDLIAGAVGIPKRILLGTERGELASSQDENNWSQTISDRRSLYAAPNIVVPLIAKLIQHGVVREPNGMFKVEWQKIDSVNETEKA